MPKGTRAPKNKRNAEIGGILKIKARRMVWIHVKNIPTATCFVQLRTAGSTNDFTLKALNGEVTRSLNKYCSEVVETKVNGGVATWRCELELAAKNNLTIHVWGDTFERTFGVFTVDTGNKIKWCDLVFSMGDGSIDTQDHEENPVLFHLVSPRPSPPPAPAVHTIPASSPNNNNYISNAQLSPPQVPQFSSYSQLLTSSFPLSVSPPIQFSDTLLPSIPLSLNEIEFFLASPTSSHTPANGLGPQGMHLLQYVVNLHIEQARNTHVRILPAHEACALTHAASVAQDARAVVRVAEGIAHGLQDGPLSLILQNIKQCILFTNSFSHSHSPLRG